MAKGRSLWAAIEPISHFKAIEPILERYDPAHIKYMFLKTKFLRKILKTQILLIKTKHASYAKKEDKHPLEKMPKTIPFQNYTKDTT